MTKKPLSFQTLQICRSLRTSATPPEQQLWQVLRNRGLCGYKFRRQVPIGEYVVDFLCHSARLVIELDGSGHYEQGQMAHDQRRTEFLRGSGFEVIRFRNDQVKNELEAVLGEILFAVEGRVRKGYDW